MDAHHESSPLQHSQTRNSSKLYQSNDLCLRPNNNNDGNNDDDDNDDDYGGDDGINVDTNHNHNLNKSPTDAETTIYCNKTRPNTFRNMSKTSFAILFLCILANFLSGSSFSLMAPFFSTEARHKGMSAFLVGVMFSVYQLVIFIFSPIFGNYLTKIGPKFIHLSSMFVGCTTTAMFGALHFCPSGQSFILLSFFCRTLQAIGYCGYMAASFAIVASEFSDRVATVYGVMEAGNTIGYMTGPLIGGILYDAGGFQTPFYVMSGLVFINGAFMYRFLPQPKQTDGKRRKTSALRLLKSPMMIIPAISVFVGAVGIKFLEPTLANHLAPFNLSPSLIGLIFFIEPFLSSVGGPFWGYLSDVRDVQGSVICIGHIVLSIAFFMAGPTFPGLQLELWTAVVSQILVGIAYECTVIPTMKCMVKGALEMGLADDIDTYGLVCGMFNSVYYLGGSAGPLIGGMFNYRVGTAVIGFLNNMTAVVCVVFFLMRSMVRLPTSQKAVVGVSYS